MIWVRPTRSSLVALVVLAACSGPVAKGPNGSPTSPPSGPATTRTGRATTTTVPPLTGAVIHAATDPVGLAAELTDVESRLHDSPNPTELFAIQALRQQLAYERLAVHPDWLPAVLAHVSAQWRATVEANSEAAIDLSALSTPLTPAQLQGWDIARPASAAALLADYQAAQAITAVPWQVLAAIHLVETKMSRLRVASSAGAQGPMQFLPATWASYGRGDINNDHDAILAAARYLQDMGARRDLAAAIYHYDPSEHYVQAVLAYATRMQVDPTAFTTYYYWQVLIVLSGSEVVLPEGYPRVPAITAG